MHNEARGIANAIPYTGLGVDALGHQHLPSVLVGAKPADYAEVTATTTVVGASHVATTQSLADIQTNWLELTAYNLTNGGPGYVLPPCKVVAFCCLEIGAWTKLLAAAADINYGLYIVLGREDSVDTGVFHADLADIGTVFCPQNRTGKSTNHRYTNMHHTVTIFTVIDRTAHVGNWTLEKLAIKAGISMSGNPSVGVTSDFNIAHGNIGFFALYRDD